MKAILNANNCKILDISEQSNDTGTIKWYQCIFMQDNNVNTLTCDKEAAKLLKSGMTTTLVITCTENPKSVRNGNGAYIENKFKITGVVGAATNNK